MPEAKHNSEKESLDYFSNNENTIIMDSESQIAKESSSDLFNKSSGYVPVIIIKGESNDGPKDKNYISQSEYNNPEKKSTNEDKVQLLLKRLLTTEQTSHIIKFNTKKKTRLLVKRGVSHIALHFSDIAAIYTKDKLVYVIDCDSKKYSIDKTLTQLEKELDITIFFRANRQYIINLNFIKSFKAYQKVKLLVDMNISGLECPIVISQLVAPAFKKWMNDA